MSDLQHERITALTAKLRLGAMADLYGAIAQDAAKAENASYADFLEQVLRAERDARRVRSASMLARTAGFPAIKTLEDYDFGFATGAPKAQIHELASLGFVERTENVVMLGPSGPASYCPPRDVVIIPVFFATHLQTAGHVGAARSLPAQCHHAPDRQC